MWRYVRFRHLLLTVLASILALGLTIVWLLNSRTSASADLPDAVEVEVMEVSLRVREFGLADVTNCRIDEKHFATVLDCLKPSESSAFAREMTVFPNMGEIRIRMKNGRTRRVDFVDAGKNPLCFMVDGAAFLRGGHDYPNYREDHLRLYKLPSEAIDEALSFAYKLHEICTGRDPMREPPTP
ncbi:MAG: hypothetical protein P4L85_15195 [Paludisphaera borealis]|uniref:hypothetical protein n=1 Tax=Paludisphaera borealis TaxID=1387353 RepID=UPI0028466E37|nr:hypothetical protein [Paludisphaera borealis]MDR3620696.1 hypothetical protein [Paludisphaera borealis]